MKYIYFIPSEVCMLTWHLVGGQIIAFSVSVCLSVCPLTSQKPHVQISIQFSAYFTCSLILLWS